MKPNKRRMKQCHDGKRRHETLDLAKRALWHFVKKRAEKGDAIVTFMRAYGCACGGFHIGRTKEINWELVAKLSEPRKATEAASQSLPA